MRKLVCLAATVVALLFSVSPSAKVITFLVASDTHFGWQMPDTNNGVQIQAMNAIEGKAYPAEIGGVVGKPLAVLVTGDLTDHWSMDEWDMFVANYGLDGLDGVLRYPCLECSGNHDSDAMRAMIAKRHWWLTYPINWPPVKLFSLDVYPTFQVTNWLATELGRLSPSTPIILFHHYGFDDYSNTWWSEEERLAYANVISNYNVIAIFHGHNHYSFHYQWQGIDVFSPGSAKNYAPTSNSFLVGRLTIDGDYLTELAVSEYEWIKGGSGNWVGGKWGWSYKKTIPVGVEKKDPPADPVLVSNFPNPFMNSTTIQLEMSEPGWATVTVFDIVGREVVSFSIGEDAGSAFQQFKWNGKNRQGVDMPSGTYLYTVTTKHGEVTGKTTLIR